MSIEIRKNTFYNIVGSLAPVALSLVVLPLYIRAIGEYRFVILALIWLTLGHEEQDAQHVRSRKYSDWVARNSPEFEVLNTWENPHKYKQGEDPEKSSFAFFRLYGRL